MSVLLPMVTMKTSILAKILWGISSKGVISGQFENWTNGGIPLVIIPNCTAIIVTCQFDNRRERYGMYIYICPPIPT